MTAIFIDSTSAPNIFLTDSEFQIIDKLSLEDKRASKNLHIEIYNLLCKHDLKIEDVDDFFFLIGPGSYTGMRLSLAFSEILKWQNKNTYCFYHQDIPRLNGINDGVFHCNAFKGEKYIFEWLGSETKEYRLTDIEWNNQKDMIINTRALFHPEKEFKENNTLEILRENSSDIFKRVKELNIQRKPYYFRPLEVEFTPSYSQL
jgi:tRNA threonylcarbamoyladenosine biosynthesis protein TsaB